MPVFFVLCNMRKIYPFLAIAIILSIASCKGKDKDENTTGSSNSADAARNFIRAALDGKFAEAATFMLQDSVNLDYLNAVERSFANVDQATKDGYRGASIRFYDPVPTGLDSVKIIVYSNSFKNNKDTLKLVRTNNTWLVDLKYLYLHDNDTLLNKPSTTDTLK